MDELLTATPEDFAQAWTDEYGVQYSQDRKRLLRSTNPNLSFYTVPEGTEFICNKAFKHVDEEVEEFETYEGYSVGYLVETPLSHLLSIELPASLRVIGINAFYYCKELETVKFAANGLEQIYGSAFKHCFKLRNITLPESLTYMGYQSLPKHLKDIHIPEGVSDSINYIFGIK